MRTVLLWEVYSMLIFLVINVINESYGCSVFCSCKWKNGKQTVECGSRNLTEIPSEMDPETQVLEFSGNKLGKLTKELFLKKHLINLQRVYLSSCKIRTIHQDTFKGLTNLVELDLSDNLFNSIPGNALASCPSLMKLTLNFNPIESLKKSAFSHLSYLNTLELSGCQIEEVEEGAFQGLHSLEWLYLDSNKLKTVRGRRTIPENIKGVELQKNPWECDCHIQDLSAWLGEFNVPMTEEPLCRSPTRLAGRPVKSLPPEDSACLPDITPTSFYLELGEGKNVSLTCHVHAVPEAKVSWWFQGQMLQNNSVVAPGVHLVYYAEEGVENKRSELFIYNANAEDNGTYVCSANNAAGTAQSNFTIRIILKEDPIVIIVSFPLEYFLCAMIGITLLALLTIVLVTVLIVKCHRKNKRRQKREKTKEVTLQYQQNANKMSNAVDDLECSPDQIKITASSANICDGDMTRYRVHSCEEIRSAAGSRSPARPPAPNQATSPASLRRYQLEQNPDLINGTDSIGCRREGDGGEDGRNLELYYGAEGAATFPVACLGAIGDVRCIVDPQGYPMDYGLPKIPCRTQCQDGYYRTLPTNRMKRHSAANPLKRFSREAEFLSRSVDSPYDYQTDVRYTADGYPARIAGEEPVYPPGSGEAERGRAPDSLPCCSPQWPACVPANLHLPAYGPPKLVAKRSASAQTDTESDSESTAEKLNANKSNPVANGQNAAGNEVLTESPDEGYEGEPSVVV